ncbi:hypothetical protein COO60DRAFT_675428 [Scenedesmus sp. NREL 46B-D3]|nr:hypothetical protein COO60DRAFT_675428 [Scenedesmus sp. NREL 46B-D3]
MASPASSTSNGKRSNPTPRHCKVQGCTADLSGTGSSKYCLKKRLCPKHLRADSLKVDGQGDSLFRFCQQCGKLELLTCFEGDKRSCRVSLAKRRLHSHAPDSQAVVKQQQNPSDVVMRTNSGLISSSSTSSSQDTCAAATETFPPATVIGTCLPAPPSPPAEPCAWSAEAAAAALAEAWCGNLQQQQEQREELDPCGLELLLDLELQRSSSSNRSGCDMDSKEELMLLLEQELRAAAAKANVDPAAGRATESVDRRTPVAAETPETTGYDRPSAVPGPAAAVAAPPGHWQMLNTWPAQQMMHRMAGAFTSCSNAAFQQPHAALYAAGSAATAAARDVPAAVAMSKIYVQQQLQAVAMQYARLAQMHGMLTMMHGQGQQAAAAVGGFRGHGAGAVTHWLPYM